MNNRKNILLFAALLIFLFSCKEKSTDTLPRDAYSAGTEGIIMRSAPDIKSEKITLIPFAEKITLTESSDKDKSSSAGKWYRTGWSGKTGWVQGSSAGTIDSVYEQIKKSMTEQKSNFTDNFVKKLESSVFKINDVYTYPGGEMEPSSILFLSNGIMVVNSRIFTEKFSNTFFEYEFLNEGRLLKVKFADSKLNFNDYADMENNSASVFKVDKEGRSITYQVKDNSFFFFNWGFVKK